MKCFTSRRAIVVALGAGLAAGATMAEPVLAQTATNAAAPRSAPVEEVIVTARKRAENVKSVPIVIDAYSAEDLNRRSINSLADLGNNTPGVAINSIAGGNTQTIYVRGLGPGSTTSDLNVEANVGVFIDGIYQTSRNTLDILSVLDINDIQLAKGPQSALFGRSTFAGALAMNTGMPLDTMAGSVSTTVGSDADYRVKGWVSTPLTQTLALRLGGGYATYDGWGKNAADPSNNLGGYEKYAFSGALEFKPTDNLRAVLSGFTTHAKNEITPVSPLALSKFNCGNKDATTGLYLIYCGELPASRVSDITPSLGQTDQTNGQGSMLLEAKFWGMKATSVSGFTFGDNRGYNDYDLSSAGTLFGVCTLGNSVNASCGGNFLPAPYTRLTRVNLYTSNAERIRTVSQELRLQSDRDGPFQWLVGGFYSNSRVPLNGVAIGADGSGLAANERLVQVSQVGTPASTGLGAYDFTANPYLVSSATAPGVVASYSASGTITRSVFGSLGYTLGDLRANVEGRYNIDDKRAQVFSIPNAASVPGVYKPINGTSVPGPGVFPVAGPLLTKSFKSFTPRVTVDYKLTPDVMFFASAAKGVRSGGFNTANPVSATGILASEVAFKEESNWTYEAGFKTRLFKDRVDLDASYFHVDWTDAQVSSFTANPTAVNPVRIVQNAGRISTDGFEAKADVAVTERYTLGGSVVYSDPKFLSGAYDGSQITQCRAGVAPNYVSALGCPRIIAVPTGNGGTQYVPSLEGLRAQRSVKLQWNLHGVATVPVTGAWVATARVDVNYNGPAYNNLMNTQSFGERTLTNLRLGVDDGHYYLALWATNLFDVVYAQNSINQPRAGIPFALSVPEIVLGETRRFGFTATVKF